MGAKEACKSTKTGDFGYKACSTFCNADHASTHCSWCKCQACQFCGGSEAAKAAAGASHTAKVASKPLKAAKQNSTKPARSPSKAPATSAAAETKATLSTVQELARVKGALRAAESKLLAAEKQLSLCRHSAAHMRAAAGFSAPPPPPPRQVAGRGGGLGEALAAELLSNETDTDGTISPVCADAVSWAQHVGVVRYSALYPGLNASSPARAFQLHLHLNDPASQCADPRSASEQLLAGDSGLSAALLFFGVLLCALCNAYSLGYMNPNRYLRAVLRPCGLATPLVR